ncbi:MAG: hypothetical protein ABI477_04565 [Chryseolinea sp.]
MKSCGMLSTIVVARIIQKSQMLTPVVTGFNMISGIVTFVDLQYRLVDKITRCNNEKVHLNEGYGTGTEFS